MAGKKLPSELNEGTSASGSSVVLVQTNTDELTKATKDTLLNDYYNKTEVDVIGQEYFNKTFVSLVLPIDNIMPLSGGRNYNISYNFDDFKITFSPSVGDVGKIGYVNLVQNNGTFPETSVNITFGNNFYFLDKQNDGSFETKINSSKIFRYTVISQDKILVEPVIGLTVISGYTSVIRFTTDGTDITDADIVVFGGGVGSWVDQGNNVYDMVSTGPTTYIAIDDNYYITAHKTHITAIEVIKGDTLTQFYDDDAYTYTFGYMDNATSFTWNGGMNATLTESMFDNCSSLTTLDLSSFDTTNVTSMYGMFRYCSSLVDVDLSSFDTSNVTSMDSMFTGCSSLTSLDLSSFDTSNVRYFTMMFDTCTNLVCITNINTINYVSTNNMFLNTNLLEPNATDQGLILNGYDWVNQNPCPDTGG